MTLANETVAVFHCLTKEIIEPFLRPVCNFLYMLMYHSSYDKCYSV